MFARRTKGRAHNNTCISTMFFSTNSDFHVTNIYTIEEKQSIILHSLQGKQKYHITSGSSILS